MPSPIRHDDVLLRLIKDVNDIRAILRKVVANLPLYDIANENTPAQITSNQNNYPPGNYDVLRLSSDASRNITGITNGVKGRFLHLFNVGSYPITLVHQSALSTAANRFSFVNASDFIIPPNGNVLLYYDATQSRWEGGDQTSIYDVLNETTPAQIIADQNNYDTGIYEVLRLSSDAKRTITGMSGGVKGRTIQIFNIGAYPITLSHQDTSSSAANRFKFSNGGKAAILPGSSMRIYYDTTQSRWVGGDGYGVSSLYAQVINSSAQSIPDTSITKIDPGAVASDAYGLYDNVNNGFHLDIPGIYVINLYVEWDDADATPGNYRGIYIYEAGSEVIANTMGNVPNYFNKQEANLIFAVVTTTGTDYYFYAYQESGSSLDINRVRASIYKIS